MTGLGEASRIPNIHRVLSVLAPLVAFTADVAGAALTEIGILTDEFS